MAEAMRRRGPCSRRVLVYQWRFVPGRISREDFHDNIHGQRINMDIPERTGSGFVGKHGARLQSNFNDRWSQIIQVLTRADGSVFMIDWYD